MNSTYRGRWAPSPTGETHLGTARTALLAWLDVRARGGVLVWRTEDLDGPRVVASAAERQLEDLRWLGLDWDEGPDLGGPSAPYSQSCRSDYYRAALDALAKGGRLFPCTRSRKELESIASAPHGPEGSAYPASLRPRSLAPNWLEHHRQRGSGVAALRFLVDPDAIDVHDRVLGFWREHVDQSVGDFVLERRDGLYAYQLAVVVDDLAMGITSVVRGADLAASTARQIQLIQALGGTAPSYAHLPLVLNGAREKLSKRDHPTTFAQLQAAGVEAPALVGLLGWSLGLLERPTPCSPRDLIAHFDWARIPKRPWLAEADLEVFLASKPRPGVLAQSVAGGSHRAPTFG